MKLFLFMLLFSNKNKNKKKKKRNKEKVRGKLTNNRKTVKEKRGESEQDPGP